MPDVQDSHDEDDGYGPFPRFVSEGPFHWETARRNSTSQASAVAYRVDNNGFMIAFTFANLRSGAVELVGLTIEHTSVFADKRAQQIARDAVLGAAPEVGLTSRQVRTAAAQKGLLAEARRQLIEELSGWVFPDAPIRGGRVRRDHHDDRFYAQLAVDYGNLIALHGRGARKHLAELYQVSEDTVRNQVSEAKTRGFWATAGRGRTGSPTPKAFEQIGEQS